MLCGPKEDQAPRVYDGDFVEEGVEELGGLVDGDDGGEAEDVCREAESAYELEGGGSVEAAGGAASIQRLLAYLRKNKKQKRENALIPTSQPRPRRKRLSNTNPLPLTPTHTPNRRIAHFRTPHMPQPKHRAQRADDLLRVLALADRFRASSSSALSILTGLGVLALGARERL